MKISKRIKSFALKLTAFLSLAALVIFWWPLINGEVYAFWQLPRYFGIEAWAFWISMNQLFCYAGVALIVDYYLYGLKEKKE